MENAIDCPLRQKTIKLKWMGTKVQYVEWLYGLHALLNQKDGKATLETLFELFEQIFGMKVANYKQYFRSLKFSQKNENQSVFDVQKKLLKQRKDR